MIPALLVAGRVAGLLWTGGSAALSWMGRNKIKSVIAAGVINEGTNGAVLGGVTAAAGAVASTAGSGLARGVDSVLSHVTGKPQTVVQGLFNSSAQPSAPAGTTPGATGPGSGQPAPGTQAPGEQSKMQRMLDSVLDQMKGDPVMAAFAAFGAIHGMGKSDGMLDAAWKVPLYAAMFGVMGKIFSPILAPFLGAGMSKLQESFHSAQVTGAPATTTAAAAPTAPAAPTPVEALRTASAEVTTPRTAVTPSGEQSVMNMFANAGNGVAPRTGQDAVLAMFDTPAARKAAAPALVMNA